MSQHSVKEILDFIHKFPQPHLNDEKWEIEVYLFFYPNTQEFIRKSEQQKFAIIRDIYYTMHYKAELLNDPNKLLSLLKGFDKRSEFNLEIVKRHLFSIRSNNGLINNYIERLIIPIQNKYGFDDLTQLRIIVEKITYEINQELNKAQISLEKDDN